MKTLPFCHFVIDRMPTSVNCDSASKIAFWNDSTQIYIEK